MLVGWFPAHNFFPINPMITASELNKFGSSTTYHNAEQEAIIAELTKIEQIIKNAIDSNNLDVFSRKEIFIPLAYNHEKGRISWQIKSGAYYNSKIPNVAEESSRFEFKDHGNLRPTEFGDRLLAELREAGYQASFGYSSSLLCLDSYLRIKW